MQQFWLNFKIRIRRLFSHVPQELQPAENNHQYPPKRGYMVVQLVEAMRYKQEGRDFAFQGGEVPYWLNPSGRNLALGQTQPPADLSTRIISWG